MKKSLVKLSLIAIVIVNILSCRHTSLEPKLEHVDSLINNNMNTEALDTLRKINSDSLDCENKAYYNLLLTMAEYKNYIDIPSDSAINESIVYFKSQNNNVLYMRSLIAKGCVNEVNGNLDSAVECFNLAENLCTANDSNYLAYTKLRLGVLYQSQVIGANTIALQKIKEALPIYKTLGDKHYELVCLSHIGSLYRNIEEKHDSAVLYIKEAINLAKEQNDRYGVFSNLFILSEYYLVRKHDYKSAKEYALKAISINGITIHPRAHYRLASSYLSLGKPDSAIHYLKIAPTAKDAMDSIVYFEVLSNLEQNYWKHDGKAKYYIELAHSIADSLTINGLNHRLLTIEKKYDLQQEELKIVSLRSRLKGAWLTVALILLAALSLIHFLWRYRNRLKAKENEYDLLKSDLNSSLSNLEQLRVTISNYKNEIKEAEDGYRAELAQQEALVSGLTSEIVDIRSTLYDKEKALKEIEVGYQKRLAEQEEVVSNLSGEITDARTSLIKKEQERLQLNEKISALEAKKKQSDEIKAILDGQIKVVHELIQSSHELSAEKFAKKFRSLMSMPEDPRIENYWSNLQVLTNDLYDNILEDAIKMSNGKLNANDINLISLLCCGYTRSVIMICMKYEHIGTISNKKYKIAKKMGIPSLDEFIRPYQEEYEKSLK